MFKFLETGNYICLSSLDYKTLLLEDNKTFFLFFFKKNFNKLPESFDAMTMEF